MKEIKIKLCDEIVYEHTCKNGLKVYIWKYDLSEEVIMTLTVKYGSVDTEFKVGGKKYKVPNGLAHFLEHVKFNEKKDVTAHDFYNKMGSYTNAYTTYDHTSYEVTCTNSINENLTHLLYFVLNSYFTKELISKEKGIIIEEAKSTLNDPYNIGYKTLMKNIFVNDKKKYLVTGTPDEVKSISLEDVKCAFESFYHPKNMFLTVTGNVNPYEIEKIVDEYFDNIKTENYKNPEKIFVKEEDNINKEVDVITENVTKEKLLMAFKIPKKAFKKYDDLHLRLIINIILSSSFGTTSKLNYYLISNNLVDNLYYVLDLSHDHVIIYFEVSTSYPNEVSKLIKDEVSNLTFDEKDFDRKVKTLIASAILGYEDATEVNSNIRYEVIRYNKIIDNNIDIFKSLTYLDGQNIIKGIKKHRVSEVILKPKTK